MSHWDRASNAIAFSELTISGFTVATSTPIKTGSERFAWPLSAVALSAA